jgi:hypothetical protein
MKRLVLSIILAAFCLGSMAAAQNNPPVLDAIGPKEVIEGENLNFIVTASDPDGTIPLLTTSELPDNATFTDNGDGAGVFDFTPSFVQAWTYYVTFYASDGIDTDSEVVTITVTESGNHPPVLDSIGSKRTMEGVELRFNVTASDPDGTIPLLTSTVQPTGNPYFVDKGLGTGELVFLPDETHIGDTIITFYAADDSSAIDSEVVTITVVANFPPELDSIGPQSLMEGDTLTLEITATDPNEGTVFDMTVTPLPENATWDPQIDGTATFEFTPSYIQAALYELTFSVTDGKYIDSEVVAIEVVEAGNRLPILDSIGPKTILEGELLSFNVTAADLDDSILTLSVSELPGNASFVDNENGTGQFDFMPDCKQQGVCNITFYVTDEQLAIDSEVVQITVEDAGNWAPEIDSIGSRAVSEGRVLEVNITAYDCEGEIDSIWIDPPVDDTVYRDYLEFKDFGDGTALFEFFPGYDQVEVSHKIIPVMFYTTDGIDYDSEEVVITVYDVGRHDQDPGEADTLILESREWDGQGELAVTCHIWNDSAISTAITGFRWFDSSLVCDSVILDQTVDTSYFDSVRIYNDSLIFSVEFIFYYNCYLDTGKGEYFTAYFHYKAGATWEPGSRIRFDTTRVGNRGSFLFYSNLNDSPPSKAAEECLIFNLNDPFVYQPLILLGKVRSSIPTDADNDGPPAVAAKYGLRQNYPNPFNPATTINFSLPRRGRVVVRVYNILGQIVTVLTDHEYEAGDHSIIWDGRDKHGNKAASGIYLYHMVSEGLIQTKKMILLR